MAATRVSSSDQPIDNGRSSSECLSFVQADLHKVQDELQKAPSNWQQKAGKVLMGVGAILAIAAIACAIAFATGATGGSALPLIALIAGCSGFSIGMIGIGVRHQGNLDALESARLAAISKQNALEPEQGKASFSHLAQANDGRNLAAIPLGYHPASKVQESQGQRYRITDFTRSGEHSSSSSVDTQPHPLHENSEAERKAQLYQDKKEEKTVMRQVADLQNFEHQLGPKDFERASKIAASCSLSLDYKNELFGMLFFFKNAGQDELKDNLLSFFEKLSPDKRIGLFDLVKEKLQLHLSVLYKADALELQVCNKPQPEKVASQWESAKLDSQVLAVLRQREAVNDIRLQNDLALNDIALNCMELKVLSVLMKRSRITDAAKVNQITVVMKKCNIGLLSFEDCVLKLANLSDADFEKTKNVAQSFLTPQSIDDLINKKEEFSKIAEYGLLIDQFTGFSKQALIRLLQALDLCDKEEDKTALLQNYISSEHGRQKGFQIEGSIRHLPDSVQIALIPVLARLPGPIGLCFGLERFTKLSQEQQLKLLEMLHKCDNDLALKVISWVIEPSELWSASKIVAEIVQCPAEQLSAKIDELRSSVNTKDISSSTAPSSLPLRNVDNQGTKSGVSQRGVGGTVNLEKIRKNLL